jgi:hypothetical protein
MRSNLEVVHPVAHSWRIPGRATTNLVPAIFADETDRSAQTFGNSAPTLVVMTEEADVEDASRDGA